MTFENGCGGNARMFPDAYYEAENRHVYKKHWHQQRDCLKPQLKPSTVVLMTPCAPPTLTGLILD